MKILVPCDFSKISNNAALYAAKFAKKVNAEIILFHVTYFAYSSNVLVEFKEHEIKDLRFSDASQECTLLTEEIKSIVKGVKVSFKVVAGFPIASSIEAYAASNKVDLIVMGTKGARGLEKVLFGSNATDVINKSSIPVITVPKYARFKKLKHIVYASDTSVISEMHSRIQKLIALGQLFDATIDILHVLPQYRQNSRDNEEINLIEIKNNLINEYKYKKISFHVCYNDDVIEAINDFSADRETDLLAMFTHDITFFEKVFNESVSREMAFHSLVPLLTIKK